MANVESVQRDYATRAGAGRQSDAERFEEEIIRLTREICLAALSSELSVEYTPVVRHLLKARRALQSAFPT